MAQKDDVFTHRYVDDREEHWDEREPNQQRQATCEKRPFFHNFCYVCPEPVLVK